MYRSFSKKDRDNLIKNLSGALNLVKNIVITKRMIAHFYQADKSVKDNSGKTAWGHAKIQENEVMLQILK